jgi:hypothetical protein
MHETFRLESSLLKKKFQRQSNPRKKTAFRVIQIGPWLSERGGRSSRQSPDARRFGIKSLAS